MNNLTAIRNLRMKMDRRPTLKQFKAPADWTKLQETTFIKTRQLGQPDKRVDCAINSLAFVGAMKRTTAEATAKMINDRKCGITSTEIAGYFEGNDGSERMPHGVVGLTTLVGVYETFSELKENMVAMIGINRLSGIGHSATVVRLGGALMIYDAQIEVLTPSINDWLISQGASSVEVVLKLDKRVHCRDETRVFVKRHDEINDNKQHKVEHQEQPRIQIEDPSLQHQIPLWKVRNFERSRKLKREKAMSAFVKEMTSAGFVSYM